MSRYDDKHLEQKHPFSFEHSKMYTNDVIIILYIIEYSCTYIVKYYTNYNIIYLPTQ